MNDGNNAFAWGKRVMMSEDDIEEQIFAEEDLLARFRQRYLTEYVFDGTEDDYHAQEEYAVRAYQRYWKKNAELLPVRFWRNSTPRNGRPFKRRFFNPTNRKRALRMSSKRRHRPPQPEPEKRNEMDGGGGAVSRTVHCPHYALVNHRMTSNDLNVTPRALHKGLELAHRTLPPIRKRDVKGDK
jgi:hypothetical protein